MLPTTYGLEKGFVDTFMEIVLTKWQPGALDLFRFPPRVGLQVGSFWIGGHC